jgi:DNA-binding transcriptional MerR regulator
MPAGEVRAAFRLSERALFDWDRRGWLTPVRIGRQKFYRTADVARIAEQGTERKARNSK